MVPICKLYMQDPKNYLLYVYIVSAEGMVSVKIRLAVLYATYPHYYINYKVFEWGWVRRYLFV